MSDKVELFIPSTVNPRNVGFFFCDAKNCIIDCGRKINHSENDCSADLSKYCINFKEDKTDKE